MIRYPEYFPLSINAKGLFGKNEKQNKARKLTTARQKESKKKARGKQKESKKTDKQAFHGLLICLARHSPARQVLMSPAPDFRQPLFASLLWTRKLFFAQKLCLPLAPDA